MVLFAKVSRILRKLRCATVTFSISTFFTALLCPRQQHDTEPQPLVLIMDTAGDEHSSTGPATPTSRRIETLIGKRRRKSFPKACYPCRCRKVRCDHNQPCGSCIKYEQPELCIYLDQNGQIRGEADPTNPRASKTSRKDRISALADLEHRMQTIAEEVVRRLGPLGAGLSQYPLTTHEAQQLPLQDHNSFHVRSSQYNPPAVSKPVWSSLAEETGAPVFVGAKSLASILVDVFQPAHVLGPSPQSDDLEEDAQVSAHDTMKLLYLTDTGSTHPFPSLWQPGASVEDICLALPDTATFNQYDTVQ